MCEKKKNIKGEEHIVLTIKVQKLWVPTIGEENTCKEKAINEILYFIQDDKKFISKITKALRTTARRI